MNSELMDLLQKSFRVTVGATASLVETLQDPLKRQETMGKLQDEWSQLADEWANKGAITEQEARRFVDSLLSRQSREPSGNGSVSPPPITVPTTVVSEPDSSMQADLQDLTEQISALREELETLKEPDNS